MLSSQWFLVRVCQLQGSEESGSFPKGSSDDVNFMGRWLELPPLLSDSRRAHTSVNGIPLYITDSRINTSLSYFHISATCTGFAVTAGKERLWTFPERICVCFCRHDRGAPHLRFLQIQLFAWGELRANYQGSSPPLFTQACGWALLRKDTGWCFGSMWGSPIVRLPIWGTLLS